MKKQNITIIILSVLIALFFTACGGGGGSMQSSSASNGNTGSMVGVFIDSPVSGLDYRCDGTIRKTDDQGHFTCKNAPVDFYLGNLKIGSISKMTDDYLVFPQDISEQPRSAALHPEVTKLAILLQSLDSDEDPSNGIDIKQNTLDILDQVVAQGTNIQDMSLDDLKTSLGSIISKSTQNRLRLVTTMDAQMHILTSMSKTYESPIQP